MLRVSVAGIDLSSPIMNASGVMCTTKNQLYTTSKNENIGAVVTKSCTLEARSGNSYPRYYDSYYTSINSMGLPNHGVNYYLEAAADIVKTKPVFISVCGQSIEENKSIMRRIVDSDTKGQLSGVELNMSCPNVPGKPQIAYDFDAMDEMLRQISEEISSDDATTLKVGVKLSPYFDVNQFTAAADVLRQYPLRWVTCINSIGNALMIDPITETTRIAPKNGLGGLGGIPVKATALANVYTFRRELPNHIDIIGCGGITSGIDVFEHILCGATAVQIGTLIQFSSLDCLNQVTHDLKQIMTAKNYTSLDDFRGRLKVTTAAAAAIPTNDPSLD